MTLVTVFCGCFLGGGYSCTSLEVKINQYHLLLSAREDLIQERGS
jgi:hypothetical protein